MSWDRIDQVAGPRPTQAPVSLALSARKHSGQRLWCTLSPETREALGWQIGQALQLDVGRGAHAGQMRVSPAETGRRLRALPKSGYVSVELIPPEDLAAWSAPRAPAVHEVLPPARGKAGPGVLVCSLPWVLPMDASGFFLAPPEELAPVPEGEEAADMRVAA